ncbi:N-acetylglucosamine-6-phosphate deacetylase [Planifilum fimeticola]|uniref:N-acetylglucosamine-6-phosphate deacetylase n=1 Tax=Planifilum fimeticola TaxID=201975 RepID=A0A2T0LJS7_9BACL|nr:N-acetylglucosamine-6-phosphate deacetylase [Planifilum fimeticola]PRX42752.1 N-acetylglucosamine-6-phosphate deacetylase [Planifilum fimeticola]
MGENDYFVLRGSVVLADGILEEGMVVIRGERIAYVGPPLSRFTDPRREFAVSGFIWPGLIDLHVHGAGGADVMDATPKSLATISRTLARHGVTGFLATTVTMPKSRLEQVFNNVAEMASSLEGARVLGIHLEGPWICPSHRGAQNPEYIVEPDPEEAMWALKNSRGMLRVVTMAPERPKGMETVRLLSSKGVIVSIGHTGATYEQALSAIDAGASQVTHCFNGMTGLHHRSPGVAGAVLTEDRLFAELIADGFHVHPAVVKLLAKLKGESDKLILISDGIRAVGMPDGEYELGGLPVFAREGKAVLADGSLAGSLLTLDQAVRNMVKFTGMPLWKAVRMASLVPARRLGLDGDLGSLETGKRADLVVTDESCHVRQVWIRGKRVFDRETFYE